MKDVFGNSAIDYYIRGINGNMQIGLDLLQKVMRQHIEVEDALQLMVKRFIRQDEENKYQFIQANQRKKYTGMVSKQTFNKVTML